MLYGKESCPPDFEILRYLAQSGHESLSRSPAHHCCWQGSTACQSFTVHCKDSELCSADFWGVLKGNATFLNATNAFEWQFISGLALESTRSSDHQPLHGPCHWLRISGGLRLTCWPLPLPGHAWLWPCLFLLWGTSLSIPSHQLVVIY